MGCILIWASSCRICGEHMPGRSVLRMCNQWFCGWLIWQAPCFSIEYTAHDLWCHHQVGIATYSAIALQNWASTSLVTSVCWKYDYMSLVGILDFLREDEKFFTVLPSSHHVNIEVFCSAIAPSVGAMLIGRFLVGAGLGLSGPVTALYVSEVYIFG